MAQSFYFTGSSVECGTVLNSHQHLNITFVIISISGGQLFQLGKMFRI